jgi:hypothetical protein
LGVHRHLAAEASLSRPAETALGSDHEGPPSWFSGLGDARRRDVQSSRVSVGYRWGSRPPVSPAQDGRRPGGHRSAACQRTKGDRQGWTAPSGAIVVGSLDAGGSDRMEGHWTRFRAPFSRPIPCSMRFHLMVRVPQLWPAQTCGLLMRPERTRLALRPTEDLIIMCRCLSPSST